MNVDSGRKIPTDGWARWQKREITLRKKEQARVYLQLISSVLGAVVFVGVFSFFICFSFVVVVVVVVRQEETCPRDVGRSLNFCSIATMRLLVNEKRQSPSYRRSGAASRFGGRSACRSWPVILSHDAHDVLGQLSILAHLRQNFLPSRFLESV